MAGKESSGFDFAAWTQAVANGGDGAPLPHAASAIAATGLALLSMSFRVPTGDAPALGPFQAARAAALDDLRRGLLEGLTRTSDRDKEGWAFERSFDALEAALAGLRLWRAAAVGEVPASPDAWRASVEVLELAARTARAGLAAVSSGQDAEETARSLAAADALVTEARTSCAAGET